MTDPVVHFAALLFIIMVVSAFVDRVGVGNIIIAIVVSFLSVGAIVLAFTDPFGLVMLVGVVALFCFYAWLNDYASRRPISNKPIAWSYVIVALSGSAVIIGIIEYIHTTYPSI